MAFSNNFPFHELNFIGNRSYSALDELPSSDVSDKIELVVFALFAMLSIASNMRVLSIILTMQSNKQRKKNILIAHLSLIGLIIQIFSVGYMYKKHLNISVHPSVTECVIESYTRNMAFSLHPINVAFIYYQRCRVLQPSHEEEKLLIMRPIYMMWTITIVGNIPVLFMSHSCGYYCTGVLLFGNLWVTVAYEIFKLAVFNLVPAVYMARSLYLIKSKVKKYLFTTPERPRRASEKKKVVKLKVLFLYLLTCIALWIPGSIFLTAYKVHRRTSTTFDSGLCITSSLNYTPLAKQPIPKYFGVKAIFGSICLLAHPLINLYLNEDMASVRWWQFKYVTQRRNTSATESESFNRTVSLPDTEGDPQPKKSNFSATEMESVIATTSVAKHAPTSDLERSNSYLCTETHERHQVMETTV